MYDGTSFSLVKPEVGLEPAYDGYIAVISSQRREGLGKRHTVVRIICLPYIEGGFAQDLIPGTQMMGPPPPHSIMLIS